MGLKFPPVTGPPMVIAMYKPMGTTTAIAIRPPGLANPPPEVTAKTIVETRIAVPKHS